MHFFIPLFTKKVVHRESDEGPNHRPKTPSYWPLSTTVTVLLPEQPVIRKLLWGHRCGREPQCHTRTLTGPLQIPLPRSHQPLLRDDGLGISQWVGSNCTGNYLYLLIFINFSPSHYSYYILFYFNYFSILISTHKFCLFSNSPPHPTRGEESKWLHGTYLGLNHDKEIHYLATARKAHCPLAPAKKQH